MKRVAIIVAAALASAGCAASTELDYFPTSDAHPAHDGGSDGSFSIDSASSDGEPGDTSTADGASMDAGEDTTSGADTGAPDTAPVDTGVLDTGAPDTAPPDTGMPDTGPPDTGVTSATFTFPASSDTATMVYAPHFWNAGDNYKGSRTTALPSATKLDTTLAITNGLTSGGTVNLQVSINGTLVGTKSITSSSGASVPMSFTFAAIAGPMYTLQYKCASTVASGAGSIQFTMDVDTVTLH